jgi:hypothetical protein
MFKLLSLLTFVLAQAQIDLDPGQAVESLRQNSAVVGILYFIVVAEAIVIIILWKKYNELNKERIEDLKARLLAEADLRKEIQEIKFKKG